VARRSAILGKALRLNFAINPTLYCELLTVIIQTTNMISEIGTCYLPKLEDESLLGYSSM
jgi:hypothetical protein